MKNLSAAIGVDAAPYGSQSARKGACTRAFDKGLNRKLIMAHGNWRSNAVDVYRVLSTKKKLSVSRQILSE
jgi:hypothetical protein